MLYTFLTTHSSQTQKWNLMYIHRQNLETILVRVLREIEYYEHIINYSSPYNFIENNLKL